MTLLDQLWKVVQKRTAIMESVASSQFWWGAIQRQSPIPIFQQLFDQSVDKIKIFEFVSWFFLLLSRENQLTNQKLIYIHMLKKNYIWKIHNLKSVKACYGHLFSRQLIDLDVSNFEYRIFVVVFCRQAQWKK